MILNFPFLKCYRKCSLKLEEKKTNICVSGYGVVFLVLCGVFLEMARANRLEMKKEGWVGKEKTKIEIK